MDVQSKGSRKLIFARYKNHHYSSTLVHSCVYERIQMLVDSSSFDSVPHRLEMYADVSMGVGIAGLGWAVQAPPTRPPSFYGHQRSIELGGGFPSTLRYKFCSRDVRSTYKHSTQIGFPIVGAFSGFEEERG